MPVLAPYHCPSAGHARDRRVRAQQHGGEAAQQATNGVRHRARKLAVWSLDAGWHGCRATADTVRRSRCLCHSVCVDLCQLDRWAQACFQTSCMVCVVWRRNKPARQRQPAPKTSMTELGAWESGEWTMAPGVAGAPRTRCAMRCPPRVASRRWCRGKCVLHTVCHDLHTRSPARYALATQSPQQKQGREQADTVENA